MYKSSQGNDVNRFKSTSVNLWSLFNIKSDVFKSLVLFKFPCLPHNRSFPVAWYFAFWIISFRFVFILWIFHCFFFFLFAFLFAQVLKHFLSNYLKKLHFSVAMTAQESKVNTQRKEMKLHIIICREKKKWRKNSILRQFIVLDLCEIFHRNEKLFFFAYEKREGNARNYIQERKK